MGWTYTHKPAGQSAAEFLHEQWPDTWSDHYYQVLDVAIVKLRTAYLAIRKTNKRTGESTTFAVVYLLNYANASEYNFGYKEISEDMGPCQYECPRRILELLSETEHPHALAWRVACWRRVRNRATLRKHPGWGILLPNPLQFRNGDEVQLFRKAVVGRKRLLTGWDCRRHYRVSLDREFLLLPPDQANTVWLFLVRGGLLQETQWHHDPKNPLHRVFRLQSVPAYFKQALEVARLLQAHEYGRRALLQVEKGNGPLSMYTLDAAGNPIAYSDDRPLVAGAAYGSWHELVPDGFVGVTASRGGRCTSDPGRFFLVPDEEYSAWRKRPQRDFFPVDPDRHEEVVDKKPARKVA